MKFSPTSKRSAMADVTMTISQVTDLARPFIAMAEAIVAYYQDPEHEQAFQAWYLERYGKTAPKGV